MVVSRINKEISYPETKRINSKDAKMDADLYQIQVYDFAITVAIGQPNTNKGIIYYPIYLVKADESVVQIGVYELSEERKLDFLDSDNNLDLELLDSDPLLYSFASSDFLSKHKILEKKMEDNKASEEIKINEQAPTIIKQELPDERRDIFTITHNIPILPELKEEKSSAKYKNYKSTDIWIQNFMRNPDYFIQANEGSSDNSGDSFFAAIRDAFSSIAQQTTITKLREKLAREADDKLFTEYKAHYDMYADALQRDNQEIKSLKSSHLLLKQRFTSTIDRSERKLVLEQAEKVSQNHDRLVSEKRITGQIMSEFKFMKGIDSLEKLKKFMKTSEFHAEQWSLATMERILNVKFIFFSRDAYKQGDMKNVLLCGQLDSFLTNKGVFAPEFYIMLELDNLTFKTIGYKKKLIFRFSEIPYDVKRLITSKCLEKNAGPFALIPDFQRFKDKFKQKKDQIDYDDLSESKLRGLYEDDVVFLIYDKSNSKSLPGKGAGEKIPTERQKEFTDLATFPKWRQKLDTRWQQPFVLDNHQWLTVEHYYQASKFKKGSPEFYLNFSLDAKTDLAKDAKMAKAVGTTGVYKGMQIRPTQVQVDQEFSHSESLKAANSAKFGQHKDLLFILKATKKAKIARNEKGKPPTICDELMFVRSQL